MKINWKPAGSAPRDKRILVCNVDVQDSAIARFSRLSHRDVVWGWVWAVEARDTKDKLCLLDWEPTHWAEAPDLPAKPKPAKCAAGKCKMVN